MSEWLQIETAPLDGTPVLLYYRSIGIVYGHYDYIGTGDWWITRCWTDRAGMPWTQWYIDHDAEEPVRWMPLPPPPETES